MNPTPSIKIYQILQRYFQNEGDAKIVIEEIQHTIKDKFEEETSVFSKKSELELLRKDMEAIELRLTSNILKSESNLKSEINKLIVWIIATMFASGALFITLAKVFFDK